jgi:hypothetical protein
MNVPSLVGPRHSVRRSLANLKAPGSENIFRGESSGFVIDDTAPIREKFLTKPIKTLKSEHESQEN